MTPTDLRAVATRVGRLAVADRGSGTPVLLWPSLYADHRFWDHVVAGLGPGVRTLAIDGPGFGRSDPPRGDVQPERYADALVDLLDALGLPAAIAVGCSWGGQVVAHLGVRSPERVRGIVMMNTPMHPSLGGHRFDLVGTRRLGATRFWAAGVARSMIGAETKRRHPERVRAFRDAFRSFDPAAAAVTARTVLTAFPGLAGTLPGLRIPTTILLGAEDRLYPVAVSEPIARLAPSASIRVLPGCGHLAPIEAPEAVVDAIGEHLPDGLPARR